MIKIISVYDGRMERLRGELFDYDNEETSHFYVRHKNTYHIYSKAWYVVIFDKN